MTEQDISLTGATGFASPLLVCANTRNQDQPSVSALPFYFFIIGGSQEKENIQCMCVSGTIYTEM